MYQPIAEAFILNLMLLAGSNLGYDGRKPSAFTQLDSDVRKGDWLAETCTIYFRMLMYTHDTVRIGDKKYARTIDEESDQWSRLNFFPSDGYTGFDCEDGAEWILELLYLLMNGTFVNPNIKAMQAFAKQYVPFFTLGFLHSRSVHGLQEYVPHAYVCLLDRDYVMAQGANAVAGAYKPAIVLESTTYTEGTWAVDRVHRNDFSEVARREKMGYIAKTAFIDNFDDGEKKRKWRKSSKTIASVPLITSQRMYGSVWMLASTQLPGDVSKQIYLVNDATNALSVDPVDLFTYQSNVKFVDVVTVEKAKYPMFDALLRESPLVAMPIFAPNKDISYLISPVFETTDSTRVWRYFVRSVDVEDSDAQKADFEKCLQQSDAFTVIELNRLKVVSSCKNASVYVYDLKVQIKYAKRIK